MARQEVRTLVRCVLGALLLAAGDLPAATLDLATQKRVRAATFEVVVPKPAETAVKYERPPPLELLPFTERNDKFWPVGTAFAITENTFVTAAHVLISATGGQGGPPVLRDAQGRTYPIENVLKFSGHQDFVVFTAAVQAAPIGTNASAPQIDEPVFAVGNALGEGVVMRDGLLTSMTPEDQDGRWKWLRYSAATSPGNSGGPLLNATGEVVGVVIGKSESENLNYALPIQHVVGAGSVARIEQRYPLRIPILRDGIVAKTDISFALPLPLAGFAKRLADEQMRAFRAERTRLMNEKAMELPPHGKSAGLLGTVEWANCPLLVMQSKEREWEAGGGSRETVDISNGGKVCTRTSSGLGMFSLDRGESQDPAFYTDARLAMDLLLEGLKLPRAFGQEFVNVTSLGAPVSQVAHRDRFARAWRVAAYALPYADMHLVVLLLPTPNGYSGMFVFAPRSLLEFMTDQLLFTSDFFYVSYYGTLPQWRVFLARPERPAALAGIKLTRDAQGLHYRSSRVDFDVPPTLLELGDSSTLQLSMSYSLSAGALDWGVGAIYVSEDKNEHRYFSLKRQPKPVQGAPKAQQDRWADMLASRGDFSPGRGHDDDYKELWRRSVVGAGYKPGDPVDLDATLLYAVASSVTNAKLPREIDDMHDQILENLRVKER